MRRYRGDRPMISLQGRTVIIVDDGIATGGTAGPTLRIARLHDHGQGGAGGSRVRRTRDRGRARGARRRRGRTRNAGTDHDRCVVRRVLADG